MPSAPPGATSKACTRCELEKPLEDFARNRITKDGRHIYCKSCKVEIGKISDLKHKGKRAARERERVLASFGLSSDDFEDLLQSQNGGCAICGSTSFAPAWPSHRLAIDHDHKTGEVRGLLCQTCNQGLGYFKDNPDLLVKASEYLQRGQA